jgi:uncharacterized protein YbjT (DUF2867 family)
MTSTTGAPPARFALAGGTRASGLAFAAAAIAAGHSVTALARTAEGAEAAGAAGAAVVMGDALVAADLARFCAAAGPDAVAVSFLGGRRGESGVDAAGNIAFIDAAVAAGLRRFVLVTSLGCGDSDPLLSPRMREVIGPVVAEKTKAEDHLRAALIAWTIVRPGGLLDGAADGQGRLVEGPPAIGRLTRGELGRLVLLAATDPESRGRVFAAHVPVAAAA